MSRAKPPHGEAFGIFAHGVNAHSNLLPMFQYCGMFIAVRCRNFHISSSRTQVPVLCIAVFISPQYQLHVAFANKSLLNFF